MKRTLIVLMGFLLLTTITCLTVNADLIVDTDAQYIVGNITYQINDTTRTYSQIIHDNNYIVFNNSGFNITSTNSITILLDTINSNILGASNDDLVVGFYANTSSGIVTFTINGFRNNQQYRILRNDTEIATPTSDGSGELIFTNDVWTRQQFRIYQSSISDSGISDEPSGVSFDDDIPVPEEGVGCYLFIIICVIALIVMMLFIRKK